MKLLPVYRTSEGTHNLGENYKTFDACKAIFKQHGIVQIFSEGRCINEWHLRPLKKGTARLAISSWEEQIPLVVLPVGINYSAFRRFGKNVFINFGEPITQSDINLSESDGKRNQEFNMLLTAQLKTLVFEISPDDVKKQTELLVRPSSLLQKIIFAFPALVGYIIHAPIYGVIKKVVWKKCNHNDHYDSVLVAALVFIYPVYLLLIVLLAHHFYSSVYVFLLLILIPFSAWSYVLLKKQVDNPSWRSEIEA